MKRPEIGVADAVNATGAAPEVLHENRGPPGYVPAWDPGFVAGADDGGATSAGVFSAALLPLNEFASGDFAGSVYSTLDAAAVSFSESSESSFANAPTPLPVNEFFSADFGVESSDGDSRGASSVHASGSGAFVATPIEDQILGRLSVHAHLGVSEGNDGSAPAIDVAFVPAAAVFAPQVLPNQASLSAFAGAAGELDVGGVAPEVAAASRLSSGVHDAAAAVDGGAATAAPLSAPAVSELSDLASLLNAGSDAFAPALTNAGVGSGGATTAQVQAALDESGLSVNGSGIKVGVLSDSFNDLGGAAADEADGALPSAANVQVLKDLPSGGTDEGRAMMEIIHDIAPGASLAFYTAFDSEQDFANGILALAADGAKVIVDDVSYFDEPFFQNGVVAQAIQTVEAEGVTYVTAAGNEASNAYQAAWTPTSGTFDGVHLTDAENFGGSIVQTITVGANSNYDVPLLVEWNQAYGAATSDLELLVFSNGQFLGGITNAGDGEPNNPWVALDLTGGATYQIVIENVAGGNPGLIKEIVAGDGVPVTISGANVGTVYGHAMTPGAITAGAVSAADTPAFGFSPASETFSSSGAGTELLFANNGTALSSPDALSPVAVSGVDDVHTTVPGGLSDFYGTSAASASLAGVAALILSANPSLTPAQVEQIMEETALPMGNASVAGAGLVQVDGAVAAAAMPGITVAATRSDAVQGGAAIALMSTAPTIADSAKSTLADATISIANGTGAAVAGDELYVDGIQNGSVGSGVTASWNAGTDTLTLTGSASIIAYETLLDQITFADTGIDASSGSHPQRTMTWSVSDGTSTYNTTSQVTIDRAPVASNDSASDAVGTIASKTASTGVLANDTDVDRDKLTVIGVSDTAHGAGNIGASLAGVYGHLTLNADGSYSYIADNAAAFNGAPLGSHLLDTFTYTESDGNGGTASAALTITLDRPPVVTASNLALSVGHTSVAASSLFTASDPDGNALTIYSFIDTGSSGHFVLNGVAQPDSTEIDVTGAQLAQLSYQGGPAGTVDTIQIRVGDGTLSSAWAGITVAAPAHVIQTDGPTSLAEWSNNYYLDATGGSGPELKFYGAAVVQGTFGAGWAPIGAVQTAAGYEVAWEGAGTNEFTIWNVDSSGNFVSVAGPIAGNSMALESYESTFGQDLNGDGSVGVPMIVIQVDGTTSLAEVGNSYVVFDNDSDPPLMVGGVPVVAGEFGAGWAPIGAVQTASGYEVAWEGPGNEFSIWNTDPNGNRVSVVGPISGSSPILESYEPVFHQDLNGDGVIGAPAAVIEANGSTDLTQIGSNYFLYDNSTGPELKFGGAPVVAGTFGAGWAPIGAEQTATGYEVAWQGAGTNSFTIWQTDSNGNFVSVVGPVSGNSSMLESYEPSFHQDLNGDGTIGAPGTVIESDGSTDLTQIGGNYFLYNNGAGPELTFAGAPVVAGTFGAGWAPIGAEQTATGYEVAWQGARTNSFTIWQTDSNGNFISVVGPVAGNSSTLEAYEPSFHQDLNGDGTIGIPGNSATLVEDNAAPSTGNFDVGPGAALEFAGATSGTVAFQGATGSLVLYHGEDFSGQIFNFAGTGDLYGSDQIDLKDVLSGPGTTAAFTGSDSGGVLTVTDAQHDTANLSLVGDFSQATFLFSDDRNGGTTIIESGASQNLAGGTLTFDDADSSGNPAVSVTAQNGGADYVGTFTADAAAVNDGQDTVGWHFNLDPSEISQTVTQSYNVTVADGAANAVTQSLAVTVGAPGSDTFVFKPGFGADVVANATTQDVIELDGFASVTDANQLQTLLGEAQAGQPQSVFQAANGGHDTLINLGNNDSITLTNVQLADLHAANFIVHPPIIG